MHAADPACGKDFDVCVFAGEHCPCDGCAAIASMGNDGRKIARTYFIGIFFIGQSFEFVIGHPNMQIPIQETP